MFIVLMLIVKKHLLTKNRKTIVVHVDQGKNAKRISKVTMTQTDNLVVIIILNWNKRDEALQCLKNVFQLDYHPYEVVLVDNGSTDDSTEFISKTFPQVHLVKSPHNLGVAGGRNLGLEYALKQFSSKALLFLDNDILMNKDCLSKLVKSIDSDAKAGIATPKAYRMSTPKIIASAGGLGINFYTGTIYDIGGGEIDGGQYDEPRDVPSCAGFTFLVRSGVFSRIKGFDNDFNPYGWEDVDFSIRARKAGFSILYEPKAVVYHKGGKIERGGALPEYERYKAKHFFTLIKKHANLIQKISLACVLPLRVLILVVQNVFHGNIKIIWSHVKGLFGFFGKI